MGSQWSSHSSSSTSTSDDGINSSSHGRPQDFFQGWAMKGSEGPKSPSRVQGQLPGGGLGQSHQKLTTFLCIVFSKGCINTSYTEVLDNICSKKPLFNISRGMGQVPLPCRCLWAPMAAAVVCCSSCSCCSLLFCR